MRAVVLLLCLCLAPMGLMNAQDLALSLVGDVQKAYSWSRLKIADLLDEKQRLEEAPIWGGEVRAGWLANVENRFYLGVELAHQRRGLKYYGAFAEYNFTPAINRYLRAIMGAGVGYSFATLASENVTISGQNPGNLSFKGASYFAKVGALLSVSRRVELELFAKGKQMILGEDSGRIDIGMPLPVTLNLDKTFTISGGIGLNFRF
ncbi:MAG: hypothetical protein K2N54_07695 [Helicobacter sp.]|nr:hypothetical protein [Helicobacter sp.]